jgi:hypothetical protein
MAVTHEAAAANIAVIVVAAWALIGSVAVGSRAAIMRFDTLAAVFMIEMAALAFAPTSLVATALQVMMIAVAFPKPTFTISTADAAAVRVAAIA